MYIYVYVCVCVCVCAWMVPGHGTSEFGGGSLEQPRQWLGA